MLRCRLSPLAHSLCRQISRALGLRLGVLSLGPWDFRARALQGSQRPDYVGLGGPASASQLFSNSRAEDGFSSL